MLAPPGVATATRCSRMRIAPRRVRAPGNLCTHRLTERSPRPAEAGSAVPQRRRSTIRRALVATRTSRPARHGRGGRDDPAAPVDARILTLDPAVPADGPTGRSAGARGIAIPASMLLHAARRAWRSSSSRSWSLESLPGEARRACGPSSWSRSRRRLRLLRRRPPPARAAASRGPWPPKARRRPPASRRRSTCRPRSSRRRARPRRRRRRAGRRRGRRAGRRRRRGGGGPSRAPPPPPAKAVRVGGDIREPRKVVDVPAVYPRSRSRRISRGS